MDDVRNIHFVGVGGAGMCGIAEVLLAEGHRVSGSDIARSEVTDRLAALGVEVSVGHAARAVTNADVVVQSSAIAADNVELATARRLGIPVLPRAAMLGALMRRRRGIAVAGTHGKTTTAAMLANIFEVAGLDPTFVIGGTVTADGGNARRGRGRHLIAEADESDASFLHLQPTLAVITNIDHDHLQTYGHDPTRLEAAFAKFAERLPDDGLAVLGTDDPRVAAVAARIDRPTRTYGFAAGSDYRATPLHVQPRSAGFVVSRVDGDDLRIASPLPGCHNAQNALAAVAAASAEGVDDEAIVRGIREFPGVARRFATAECVVADKHVMLLDDYGHHPTEIAHVVATARRLWHGRRLVMVYQPHRYSRTRDLFEDFVLALSQVDLLILADIYAASEAPIADIDGEALASAINARGEVAASFAPTPQAALAKLVAVVAEGDVVMVQGAGDIDRVATAIRG